jgi:hypothetical protein
MDEPGLGGKSAFRNFQTVAPVGQVWKDIHSARIRLEGMGGSGSGIPQSARRFHWGAERVLDLEPDFAGRALRLQRASGYQQRQAKKGRSAFVDGSQEVHAYTFPERIICLVIS